MTKKIIRYGYKMVLYSLLVWNERFWDGVWWFGQIIIIIIIIKVLFIKKKNEEK